jgi:hypothetical protein
MLKADDIALDNRITNFEPELAENNIKYELDGHDIYLLGSKEDVFYCYNLLLIKLNKLNRLKSIDEELNKQKENYLKLQRILQSNSKLLFNYPMRYMEAIDRFALKLTENKENVSCFIDEKNDRDEFTLILYGNDIDKDFYTRLFELKEDYLDIDKDLSKVISSKDNIESLKNLMNKAKIVIYKII